MSLNHHILAKAATDAVLKKFKTDEWSYGEGKGKDFYRIGTNAYFPSPDAAFFDPVNGVIASFEFKPPTETKRGILTGVGQSIAYLQNSDISFLVAPKRLEDYDLESYLDSLYRDQIVGKIPTGLILYDNNDPTSVDLIRGVDTVADNGPRRRVSQIDRFWAKHQDLPIPLFHLILHYYYLARTRIDANGDPFAKCFKNEFITPTVLDDFQPRECIYDLSGSPIKTVAGTKNIVHLETKLRSARTLALTDSVAARNTIQRAIDTDFVGDNFYNAVRKNYLSFMKHIQVIDSENTITDTGFALYHIGLVNGPTSRVFNDYFLREVLTTGHHLDLILDFDALKQKHRDLNVSELVNLMETEYEEKGYIKRNPNRRRGAQTNVRFLKYERILWNSVNLMDNDGTINWKKITEICSLPDLI